MSNKTYIIEEERPSPKTLKYVWAVWAYSYKPVIFSTRQKARDYHRNKLQGFGCVVKMLIDEKEI